MTQALTGLNTKSLSQILLNKYYGSNKSCSELKSLHCHESFVDPNFKEIVWVVLLGRTLLNDTKCPSSPVLQLQKGKDQGPPHSPFPVGDAGHLRGANQVSAVQRPSAAPLYAHLNIQIRRRDTPPPPDLAFPVAFHTHANPHHSNLISNLISRQVF